jgi:hypothetical protein
VSTHWQQLGKPRDNYIYAWFNGRRLLYIGKGTASRGLNACWYRDKLIDRQPTYRCVVLLDGMGRREAAEQEAAAIRVCSPRHNVRSKAA